MSSRITVVPLFRTAPTAGNNPFRTFLPCIDDSNNFAEVVQDENADTPYEQLEEKTVTRMLQEMVKTLDEREATILRYRFGLDGLFDSP